ncbi:XdhC family protein [Paenibacillus alkaliterrae]|uniref:XdhC family protein n=1 Tax=Paenibacillus alkaliterrae TaxID=320909 RepID=UPI001F4349F6|nr:XdhC family protein [Paenibacillus alkaliterrae]MCF2937136.1 XdhC family protein [Paenibacillus alkaliterrae]
MELHDVLSAIQADERPSVLATIVCVEGHSYRKAGATMLIKLSGEKIGMVSPGCLEQDLAERAASVWASGRFDMIEYNMNPDEDMLWGDAVGCGGKIQLLLEPVTGLLRSLLLDALKQNAAGLAVRLDRSWTVRDIEYALLVDGSFDDSLEYTGDEDGDSTQMRMVISPKPRLVLFGAGKDVEAICSIAKHIGFHIVIADWRPELCTKERFPEAECAVGMPEQLVERLQLHSEDYLLICSHNLHQDKEMLRLTLPLQLVYIGIMGSKKRIRLLFETFLIPSNVRAPVGLSIGADGPSEIAVSVAAELIAVRAGRKSRSRREAVRDAYFSSLFGGRAKQANGRAEAVAGAIERQAARLDGAACSIFKPS